MGYGTAAFLTQLAQAHHQPTMPGFNYKFLEKPKQGLLCPLWETHV